MDITLRRYLDEANELHNSIEKYYLITDIDKLEDSVLQLQINIRNIQAVAKRLADISNNINMLAMCKKAAGYKHIVDPYPTSNDHAMLQVYGANSHNSKEILPNVKIIVKTIDTIAQLPITYMYYVSSIGQYAVNINGVNIIGNLANIVPYQHEQSARCMYGIKCKSFEKQIECKYYHDYTDYLKLKLPVPANIRNFTIGSFIHSKKYNASFTRHIGSADTLSYDLSVLKSKQYLDEISTREGQLMHDMLIYLILHNKGMLEHYPRWHVK